jgi:multiple sugar transport system substrate-binding protein
MNMNHLLSRRSFLRLTGAAAAGVAISACAPAVQPGAATGAEGAAPAGEQVTVRWQDWADWEPTMDRLMALLNEKLPGITVEFEPLSDGFEDKTLTMMVAGTAPDVMTAWGPIFRKWSEKGQLMDLQPNVELTFSADQIDDFHEWQWNGMVAPDSGIRFAMPYYVNVVMLLYHKDAFDEAGVAYPTAEMDHTDYAEMLQQVTKREGDQTQRWGGFVQAWSYDRFQFHIQAYGGHVANPDDWTECWLGQPEAQEALEWMRARMWDDNSITQPLQVEQRGEAQMWPTGLVSTQEGGMGNIAFYARDATFNWALMHLPKGPARRATIGTTDGWGIYKGTPQPEASWELMKVLVGDDFQSLMIEAWGGLPNRLSLVPSWKETIIGSFPVLENANLDVVLEALDEGYPMLTEEFKKQAESQQLIDAALQKVFQVGDTPVSYFEEVAQQVTTLNREA